MTLTYKNKPLHLFTSSKGIININNNKYWCDDNAFAYIIKEETRQRNEVLTITEEAVNGIYHYSDGTPCDKEGYIYATIDDELFKLLQPIQKVTCEKQCIKLEIDTPNYFITNADKELQHIKKWVCLEIYVNRNSSQEDRNLTFLIHEMNTSSSPILVTIVQEGDKRGVKIKNEKKEEKKYKFSDDSEFQSHKIFSCQPQENSETLTIDLDIQGGNKQAIVKSINQCVVSKKLVIKKTEDISKEEIKNSILDNILNYEISKIELNQDEYELPCNSIYDVNKLSEYVINKYKEQAVLRYYYENDQFQNYNGPIYDSNGYEVNLIVESTTVMVGNQQSQQFSYNTSFVYEEQETVEEVDYDNAFIVDIDDNQLTIKSFGCLSLEGDVIHYRIRIAHVEDYTKFYDIFVTFDKSISNSSKQRKNRRKLVSFDKEFNVSYNKGSKTIFFDRNNAFNVTITKQNQSKWLKTNVVNNYFYLYFDNNVMNEERNEIVTLTNGDIVKNIKITQEPYKDYKIQTEYKYYNLSYNEDKFVIKIMVYGGNQKLIIDDSKCDYKYRIIDTNKYDFFTSYFIEITPILNDEIQIINNELTFKHGDDENINTSLVFEQVFNEDLLIDTILCDNVIELEYDSTQYTFNVETYPYDDSAISCQSNFYWLKPTVHNHTITLHYNKNYFNNRSCKLTIYNNEFIDKPKVVEIIQKGAN